MWNRRRTWLVLAALSCVALAGYFEPTHCVRGWLWGEAFFDGRPTSYWRGVVAADLKNGPPTRPVLVWPAAEPNWWERSWGQCKDWIGYRPREDASWHLLHYDNGDQILDGMKGDNDSHVAGFACDALELRPQLHRCRGMCGFPTLLDECWRELIRKHNPSIAD